MSTATATRPVRALSRDEHEAFRLARLVAAETMPYFMHGLFAAAPLAWEGLGTFAVDRHWRLYMDPALLVGPQAWGPQVAGAVLLHEVGHLLRDHAGRAEALAQPCDREAWNIAGDAEINDDLLAAGVPLPEGVVTPPGIGCEDNGLAEDYYARLVPDSPTGPTGAGGPSAGGDAGEPGEVGCGSGAGCPVPGELPEAAPAGDGDPDGAGAGMSAAEADLVRRRVAEDVKAAVAASSGSKSRGTVPAGLARWAEDVLAPPTVPWDRVLRAAVRRAVAEAAGRADYSYRRPSRRRVPGLVKPAMRGPLVRVAVVVDTSGSMSKADLDAAMGEVQGVLAASGIARDQVRLVSCDAAAGTTARVRRIGDVTLTGGGGTDMRVGIAAAEAIRPRPHVVIVLTDGYTPWPEAPGRSRLICGVIRDSEPTDTPEWAITVHIPPAA